jgi:DNA recombination protein RmuC
MLLVLSTILALFVAVLFLLLQKTQSAHRSELDQLRSEQSKILGEKIEATSRLEPLQQQLTEAKQQQERDLQELNSLRIQLTRAETTLQQERNSLEQLQRQFREEFQNLTNRIFQEKGKDFAKLNKSELELLLKPLASDIEKFKKQVEEKNESDIKRASSLEQMIKHLSEQSSGISKDAQALTQALRGDNKVVGDYGEVLLKQLLESAGLQETVHFVEQGKGMSLKGEEGNHLKPDFVLLLPGERYLVVDSKMSLKSYTDWSAASTEDEKKSAANEFTLSLKAHINSLDSKKYADAFQMDQTPDLILLFIPIEHAFHLAVHPSQSGGKQLFNYAWERGVVLVSPTTLLATARTIEHIWRREKIDRNAAEIVKQASSLHDKFVGFLEDLNKIQKGIEDAQKAFDAAKNKLSDGRGNLVGKAQRLKELGIKTDKSIPEQFSLPEDEPLSLDEE